jgi:hypothetical protein
MDANSSATLAFNGTAVSWIGYQDEWSGIANVYVDGNLKAQVDTYRTPNQAQSAVYSVSGLSDGPHTLTITATGQKNPASGGAWVWVDAFDVTAGSGGSTAGSGSGSTATTTPTPTPTPGPATTSRVEQNGSGIVYSGGTWYPNNGAFNSGGSAVLSQDPGARATFTFNGTGATWIAYRDEWSGIARVYVDGAFTSTIDTYATPSQAQQKAYSVTGLAAGTHTLVVEVTGTKSLSSQGTWVWVDAFDVVSGGTSSDTTITAPTSSTGATATGGSTTTPTGSKQRVEESSSAVTWSGNWFANNGGFNSGASAKLAMDAGSRATFTFTGNSVSWIGFKDQWSGIANVYIDGNLAGTVDTYSATSQAQAVAYTASNLAWGTHTIAIEATSTKNASSQGAWVWVDAFDYVGQ